MRQFPGRVVTRIVLACALLILSGGIMLGLASFPQKAQAATAPIKIMPLGDSITGSPGCWRALLWNKLQNTGYTNINFVGTLNTGGCGVSFDQHNEGHGGYLATNIANQNLLPGWLSATNPDIVIMHLGTNDVWNHLAPTTILAAYSTLVNQMRANNPRIRILVAQILPMNPSGCSTCAQGVINLDAAIPGWANSMTTAQSPIVVVDQWTGFNDSTDTVDGVHPNASGNAKVAAKWYPALTAQIQSISNGGGTTPTPTPTSGNTPTPTPTHGTTPTPVSGASCSVHYAITNQWPGGFGASLTITNTGSTAINSWSLGFSFPNGQTITQLWNGTDTQNGSVVTITNVSYNASIPPGQAVSSEPGFNGSWNGTNGVPTAFTLNGSTCSVA